MKKAKSAGDGTSDLSSTPPGSWSSSEIELRCTLIDLAGNQAEKEILVMTIKGQLINDILALPESAEPTATAPADKKKEGYAILKQFKGTLPADFDYRNKLMETLDEKYGSH
jgi:hypothetical protein